MSPRTIAAALVGLACFVGRPALAAPDGASAFTVRFEPETPGLTLLRAHAVLRVYEFRDIQYFEAKYPILCKSPCEKRLRPGPYELALSKDGRTPVAADPVEITGPSVLHAGYTDRRPLRYLGLGIAVGGFGGGMAMLIAGTAGPRQNTALSAAGAITGAVGLILGAYFGFRQDEARIDVVPLDAASPHAAGPVGVQPQAQGLALRLRF